MDGDERGLSSEQPPGAARPDLDPALQNVAHPSEAQRIRRGVLLGSALGVLLLVLARRRRGPPPPDEPSP